MELAVEKSVAYIDHCNYCTVVIWLQCTMPYQAFYLKPTEKLAFTGLNLTKRFEDPLFTFLARSKFVKFKFVLLQGSIFVQTL